MEEPDLRTLSAQNRTVLEPYLKALPESIQASVLDQLQRGYESSVSPTPPQVNDKVPDFSLRDAAGNEYRLSDFNQPLVLSFFRGGWCPACTVALKALERRYPAITTHGGEVLGISPDSPTESRRTAKTLQLSFPLLSDPDNEVSDAYGLRSSIAPLLAPIYRDHGIDFPQDCERLDVPYPATFILSPDGVVEAAFVNKDPTVRMDPEDIAGIVRKLKPT